MEEDALIYHCCKPLLMSKKDKEDLDFFRDYFESKKVLPAFPFVIFCDHVPAKSELDDILNRNTIYKKTVRQSRFACKII